ARSAGTDARGDRTVGARLRRLPTRSMADRRRDRPLTRSRAQRGAGAPLRGPAVQLDVSALRRRSVERHSSYLSRASGQRDPGLWPGHHRQAQSARALAAVAEGSAAVATRLLPERDDERSRDASEAGMGRLRRRRTGSTYGEMMSSRA